MSRPRVAPRAAPTRADEESQLRAIWRKMNADERAELALLAPNERREALIRKASPEYEGPGRNHSGGDAI